MSKSLDSLRSRRTSAVKDTSSALTQQEVGRIAKGTDQLIAIETIRTDGGTQPRVAMDVETIAAYVERMSVNEAGVVIDPEGAAWPALELFEDEQGQRWLADGFHRYMAAQQAGLARFQAHVQTGEVREAILYSMGVNATHGKRRTNADKRRAVTLALQDGEWGGFTNARIAKLCKVSSSFVDKLRAELEQEGTIAFKAILVTEDEREIERQPPPSLTFKPHPQSLEAIHAAKPPTTQAPQPLAPPQAPTYRQLGFTKLARCEPANAAVLFAQDERELDLFLARVHKLLPHPHEALVLLPLARRSSWLWRAPAALNVLVEQHGFEQPDLLTIKAHARTYLIWTRQRSYPEDAIKDPAELFTKGEEVVLIGTALGGWG